MQINVSQLLKEPIGSSRDYEVSEAIDVNGDGGDRKVDGEVSLLRTHRGILVKGELQSEVELTCSRCLSLFHCPVRINFEEEYIPTIDVLSGVPLPSPEESSSFVIDEHHVIDLNEAIRQYALLTLPMKPLCREDCTGLYQESGHNLSQEPRSYPSQAIDPRWSELSELL
jgi:uncharacterized protein